MITSFGAELRKRRGRMSRNKLARLSGVSESQIGNLETQDVTPGRWTVISLASEIPGWDVDSALRLADPGYTPLTDDEQAELAATKSPREQLDRLLDELPPSVVHGFLVLARSILNPLALPSADDELGDDPDRRDVNVQYITKEDMDAMDAADKPAARTGEDPPG